MSKKSKEALKKALQWIIYLSVALFIYNKLDGNLSELGSIRDVSIPWLIASVIIFATHSLYNGLNWHYMVESAGFKATRVSQMDVYLRSYILRYIPGNVVGIISRALYNKPYKIPMIASLWGWFIENITYLTLGLMIGSFVFTRTNLLNISNDWIVWAALLIGVVVILANDWLKIIFNKFLVPRLSKKAKKEFVSLDIPLSKRIVLMGRYLFSWAIYSLSFIALIKAFGQPIDPIVISINAMSWSLGYLSLVTPSGSGVREGIMVALLTSVSGLSFGVATAISIMARIVFILGEVIAFGIFYLYKLISEKYGA